MMHFVSIVSIMRAQGNKVYCYEQGCKYMLSIGEKDLAKSTIFRYWGNDLEKLTRLHSADVQFFAHNEVKTKKKGRDVPRCPIFCPK